MYEELHPMNSYGFNYLYTSHLNHVSKRSPRIETAEYQCQTSAKLTTAAVKRDMQEITAFPL